MRVNKDARRDIASAGALAEANQALPQTIIEEREQRIKTLQPVKEFAERLLKEGKIEAITFETEAPHIRCGIGLASIRPGYTYYLYVSCDKQPEESAFHRFMRSFLPGMKRAWILKTEKREQPGNTAIDGWKRFHVMEDYSELFDYILGCINNIRPRETKTLPHNHS